MNLIETPSPQPAMTPPVIPTHTPSGNGDNGTEEDEERNRADATALEDPDFDPDNVVIRGAPFEEDDDDYEEGGDDKLNDGGGDINTTASTYAQQQQQLGFSNAVHS